MKNEKAFMDLDGRTSSLQRRIRILLLLDTAQKAGLTPLPILQLHTFAYLSNVLSPVWDMPALEGKILKRRGGPFYPSLQRDVDRLVGMGVVVITNISHVLDENNSWRLEGSYRLNQQFATRILQRINYFEKELRTSAFLQELAYGLSALSNEDFEQAANEDATYADPIIDIGNVVDFAEWRDVNYSANVARYFGQLLMDEVHITRGEMLHLYLHHLYRRLHGGR